MKKPAKPIWQALWVPSVMALTLIGSQSAWAQDDFFNDNDNTIETNSNPGGSTLMSEGTFISSGQDLQAGAQTIHTASAGRDIDLNGTTVLGPVSAGREIEASNCRISGNV